ncbi:MAG: hypothetical protein ACRY3E_02355 [Candidatus Lariskella arthropodorum]
MPFILYYKSLYLIEFCCTGDSAGSSSSSSGGDDGGNDDDDDEIKKLVKEALEGGKNVKYYKNNLNAATKSLKEAIKSFGKQIRKHEDKIRNPEKYYHTDNPNANPPQFNWENLPDARRSGIINGWKKEIQDFKVQRALAKKILNDRTQGDL